MLTETGYFWLHTHTQITLDAGHSKLLFWCLFGGGCHILKALFNSVQPCVLILCQCFSHSPSKYIWASMQAVKFRERKKEGNTFIQGKEQQAEIKPLLLKGFYWSADTFQHQGQLHCRQASDDSVATGDRNDTSSGQSKSGLIYSWPWNHLAIERRRSVAE